MDIGALGIYMCLFLALYFEVFLLISFFEKRPNRKSGELPKRFPTVTVIIPCWNKACTLGGTVESLLALDYPKDKLSVLIIDDGSTDGTLAAARAFEEYSQVRILHKENEGSKYAALNFGLEHSKSELVGCLDADSFVAPDALLEAVKKFEREPGIMAVAPAMKVNRPRNMLELMQAVEYTFGVFYKKMFDNLGAISVLPGPFSIYRRELFERIGPFRKAHHTEDMEIAFRMHAYGLKLANVHTAMVYTNVPRTLRSLVRQRTRWSRGFLENSRDYSYMYLNKKYGNFGMLVLPFGLTAFFAGIYTAGYFLYRAAELLLRRVADLSVTGIPLHLPAYHRLEWFYFNTSMMTVLIVTTLGMTLGAILLGQRIAYTRLSVTSLFSYFALFGFVAPLWLARAVWDALMASERGWLT